MEAFCKHRTAFVRTPKLGVLGGKGGQDGSSQEVKALVRKRERTYTGDATFWQALVEIVLGLYYVGMAFWQFAFAPQGALITLVLSIGLFTMGGATMRALWIRTTEARKRLEAVAAEPEGDAAVASTQARRQLIGALGRRPAGPESWAMGRIGSPVVQISPHKGRARLSGRRQADRIEGGSSGPGPTPPKGWGTQPWRGFRSARRPAPAGPHTSLEIHGPHPGRR